MVAIMHLLFGSLKQECFPEGFHKINSKSVLRLADLAVNLFMQAKKHLQIRQDAEKGTWQCRKEPARCSPINLLEKRTMM